jgi:sugar-specific transcriptional regulator TrmB
MIKTLAILGLSQTDAEVYVYLATNGPQKARNIAEALATYKQRLYRSLKNLHCKGCIKATDERPAVFSAEPFEKVLDQFIKAKNEEAQRILQNKEECLSSWHSMTKNENEG